MPDSNGSSQQKETTQQRVAKGMQAFGERMSDEGQREISAAQEGMQRAITQRDPEAERQMAEPSSYRRGGKVRKSGRAMVHKGERILTRAQQMKLKKRLRVKRGRV